MAVSFGSFVLVDEKVYELCSFGGGHGYLNALPWDYDGDGNTDLLVSSSSGSGIHRSEISVFNRVTKKSEVVYNSFKNGPVDMVGLDLAVKKASSDSVAPYEVCLAEVEMNYENGFNGADLSYKLGSTIGFVTSENGKPVYKALAE